MNRGLLERLRRSADTLRTTLREAAPAAAAPPAAPVAAAAEVVAKPVAPTRSDGWVAVCVCGMDGDLLGQVVATSQAEAAAVGRRVVFVSDLNRFDVFRERQATVEQVVDAEARARTAPDLPWSLYRLRQFRLLGRKWKPHAVITFGRRPPAECLDALRTRAG